MQQTNCLLICIGRSQCDNAIPVTDCVQVTQNLACLNTGMEEVILNNATNKFKKLRF